jgi:hypothetical protein
MRAIRAITRICLFVGFSASYSFAQQDVEALDKKFFAVSAALWGSTIFDTETTFSCIELGACREGNPIMQPFYKAGRPATYGFYAGVNGAVLYSSYRLRKSSNPTARKLWWVIPVVMTVSHALAGGTNLRFSFK